MSAARNLIPFQLPGDSCHAVADRFLRALVLLRSAALVLLFGRIVVRYEKADRGLDILHSEAGAIHAWAGPESERRARIELGLECEGDE